MGTARDMTEGIHNNDPVEKLKLYMCGWKAGAAAMERKYDSGPYAEGYSRGTIDRIAVTRQMTEGYGVNVDVLVERVLR